MVSELFVLKPNLSGSRAPEVSALDERSLLLIAFTILHNNSRNMSVA